MLLPPRVASVVAAPVLVPLIALILALAACSSLPSPPLSARQPPAASALAGDWLDGGSSLRRAHLERLLDVASQDPEAIALLERAAKALHRSGPGDLFELLTVCERGEADEGGHTFLKFDIGVFSLDVDSLLTPGKLSPVAQAQLDAASKGDDLMRLERQDFADYIMVKRSRVPHFCLARGIDVASAYEALLHELVHAALRDPHFTTRKASESDDASFLEAFVQAPGDEVDAYLAGSRARIRLERGRGRVHRPLQPLLDDQGNLVAGRLIMARAILAPPPAGLGYAAGALRDARRKSLEAEAAERTTRQRVVDETLALRREQRRVLETNVGVHQHNVAAHRQNAAQAQAAGQAAAAQQSLGKAREAEKLLADTQRQLPA
ncbi:MAG: hypothetical protein EOO75_03370, partial [Myxococcales bacterium]